MLYIDGAHVHPCTYNYSDIFHIHFVLFELDKIYSPSYTILQTNPNHMVSHPMKFSCAIYHLRIIFLPDTHTSSLRGERCNMRTILVAWNKPIFEKLLWSASFVDPPFTCEKELT